MTAGRVTAPPEPFVATTSGRTLATGSGAVIILQVFAITLFVFPSDTVIRAIGASGYVASLVGLLACMVWVVSVALGIHRPRECKHPLRLPVIALWTVMLVSYFLMNRGEQTDITRMAADRWILQLAMITGVVFLAAEGLHSLEDVRRVVRAVVAGGAFCGVVAALQFWTNFDLTPTLRSLPGFSLNASNVAITTRDSVLRVAGTAIHPIELGVVAGMILPLAIWLACYDVDRRPLWRWLPVLCIGVAIPVSVSRSGVIAVAVATVIFIVLLPPVPRLVSLALVPVSLLVVYTVVPTVVNTLGSYFAAGSSDRSVATRLDDFPLVERLVGHHPLFGQGGGSYIAADAYQILDNEYFKTAVELGIFGLCALFAFYLAPMIAALSARRRSQDLEVRMLCAALAGASAAAVVCSATFDALSFPMFVGTEALVVGLSACLWRLTTQATNPRGAP